jgi:excisionase family DNA binding protein
MSEDPLLTIRQVAERLNISAPTVGQLLRVGLLPGVRIGRVWRVPRDDLARFLAEARQLGGVPSVWPPRADRTPKGGPRRQRAAR